MQIFAANSGVTYPILMGGGLAGFMQDYDCLYDLVFVVDGSGTIRFRGLFDDAAVRASIDQALADLASPAPDLPAAASTLHAARPNPFNPRTTIPFEIAGDGGDARVTLEVLDLRGRLVSTLADGARSRGRTHEVVWNGTDAAGRAVPSGTYIARLRVDGAEQSRLLTLVR